MAARARRGTATTATTATATTAIASTLSTAVMTAAGSTASAAFNWSTLIGGGDDFDGDGDHADGEGDDADGAEAGAAGPDIKQDSVVFLIDCHPSMFVESPELQMSPFRFSCKIAKQFCEDKIIANDQDLIGVAFYNTLEEKNPNQIGGVYVAVEMDTPSAPLIGLLDRLATGEEAYRHGHFGSGTGAVFPFGNALWAANVVFASVKKTASKRLWLFTCCDNPNAFDRGLREAAKVRADDLVGLGIETEPFFFNPAGAAPFDVRKFFVNILSFAEDEVSSAEQLLELCNPISKFEQIVNNVRKKEHKKRTAGTLSLTLGPGLAIGFKAYNLLMQAKKAAAVKLEARSHAPLKAVTAIVSKDDGARLQPNEIETYIEYGNVQVPFTKAEMAGLKRVAEPSLSLLGFKPRASLLPQHQLKHSVFLFPNEEGITGSIRAFAALSGRMLASDRIAICRLIQTRGAEPSLVALLPQAEEVFAPDAAGDVRPMVPAGFHLVTLPYTEDLRELTLAPAAATPAHVELAKDVVRGLTTSEFRSEAFLNPALQRHYAVLQALALERDPVIPDDTTVPDVQGIESCAPAMQAFMAGVSPAGGGFGAAPPKAAGTKRKREADDDGAGAEPAAKKVKTAPAKGDLASLASSGGLDKLTIPQLKQILTEDGVTGLSGLKKAELLDKVKTRFHL